MQRLRGSIQMWGQQPRLVKILASQVEPSCNGYTQTKEIGVTTVSSSTWTCTIFSRILCAMCVGWILKGWHFAVQTVSSLHATPVLRSRIKRSTRTSGQIIDASQINI